MVYVKKRLDGVREPLAATNAIFGTMLIVWICVVKVLLDLLPVWLAKISLAHYSLIFHSTWAIILPAQLCLRILTRIALVRSARLQPPLLQNPSAAPVLVVLLNHAQIHPDMINGKRSRNPNQRVKRQSLKTMVVNFGSIRGKLADLAVTLEN